MYLIYFFTIIIATTHLVNYLKGRFPLYRQTPLNIPLLIFIFSQSISTFFSIDAHTSFFGYYSRLNGGLLSIISFSILYFILSVYISQKLISNLVTASLTSATIVTFFGIVEHFNITQYSAVKTFFIPVIRDISQNNFNLWSPIYALIAKEYWQQDMVNRVFSTLGQPNWLAAYLCIIIPLALSRLQGITKIFSRLSYIVLLLSFYTCLLFTKSKSGILASIISITVYSAFYFIKNKRQNFVLPITVYGLLFILFISIPNPIKEYFFMPHIPDTNPQPLVLITPSDDIRKIVWQGSLELWRQFPIFGTGPETFAYSYYWTRPSSHNLTSEWNFLYNKAHNEYLNFLATTGTIGFLSYIYLIYSIILILIRSLKLEVRNLAILVSFLSILITNFFGFSISIVSIYFFLLPALVLTESPPIISKSKPWLFYPFLLFIFYFLLSTLFRYYLADIAYAIPSLANLKYALTQRPNEPIYLSKYAQVLAEKSVSGQDRTQIETASATLDSAIQLSPFNLNLWKERAQTCYYLAQLDTNYYLCSLDSMTKATQLAPTDAMSFYILGKFYQNISRLDEAIINYQQAIKLKSNYDHATFALGEIYFKQGKYDLSQPLFEKTILLAPTNSQAKDYLNKIATISATKR
jgi:O-antigen ligase